MYFNLPTSSDRQNKLTTKSSSSSLISTDSTTTALMAEDRISEIIHNLDDHWGSPPILTPDTLAHILDHQWISGEEEQVLRKKINSRKSGISRNDLKLSNENELVTNLIKELCKTMQSIDTENKFDVSSDIKNDPVIKKFILSKEGEGQPENVLEHLVELLKQHNNSP